MQLDQKRGGYLLAATGLMLVVLTAGLGTMDVSLGAKLAMTIPVGLLALLLMLGGWGVARSLRLVVTDHAVLDLRGTDVVHHIPLERVEHLHYRIERRGSASNRSTFHVFEFVDREQRLTFQYALQFVSQEQMTQLFTFLHAKGVAVRVPR